MKTRTNNPAQPGKPSEANERNRDGLAFRAAQIETRAAEGDKPASVRMSVSSEAPVLTWVNFNGQYLRAYEVLDHGDNCVDMARCKDGLVILDRHYGDQIGLMAVTIADRKLGGPVQFCTGTRAQEIAADAAKGLRRNVSVGYRVSADSYRLEGEKDGIPVVRAMSWMPYEASFEPVPADTTVGVGRAAEVKPTPTAPKQITIREDAKMDPKEMAKLYERAAQHGVPVAKVTELLTKPESARAELDGIIVEKQSEELKAMREAKPVVPAVVPAVPALGGSPAAEQKIVRAYSLLNVLRRACGIDRDARGNKVDCGLEDEISQECRRLGLGSQRGGQFVLPHAVLAQRDFTVSGTTSYSVATNKLASEFIPLLRTRSVLGEAGVQFLTGLVGNISIPKMTGGSTGYWVAEGSDITESEPTLNHVAGSPHTCGVKTDISRRMLLQSTPDAEAMVRDEIVERIIRTIQIAVFAGTGADGQPSAITSASGINNPTVTQGTPTYAEILDFPGNIEADNATMPNQKWIMTSEVWAKLAATFTNATYGEQALANWASRTMLGFPYLLTEDVPANSLWFGAWNTVVVGVWGAGVDLNLDTATLSSSGGLRIVGLQDVDVMVREGKALAYNTAVTS